MRHSIQRFLPLLLIGVLLLALPLAAGAAGHPSDHQPKYVVTVTTPATCEAPGVTQKVCSVCNHVEYEYPNALGHKWGTPQVTSSTCTVNGKERFVCQNDAAHVRENELPLIPHDMNGWQVTTRPTCFAVGEKANWCRTCNTQNQKEELPMLVHSYTKWQTTINPTCKVVGKRVAYCDNGCGTSKEQEVPMLPAHSYGNAQTNKAATCLVPGEVQFVCGVCGDVKKQVLPALDHDWGQIKTVSQPTCNVAGSAQRVCRRDASHVDTTVLPALGKNQPAGHKFGNWAETKAPKCDAVGTEERSCSDCGRKETREIKKIPHTSNNTWVTSREPSLQQPGLQTTTCTVCNKQASSRTFAPRSIKYEMPSYAFGALANLANPAIAGQDKLIYIDMTQPGEKRFPLVTEDGYHIADVRVTVGAGTLSVKLEKLNNSTVLRYRTWHFFPSAEEVTRHKLESDSLPFEQPVAVSGDSCVIAVRTLSNYSQSHRENSAFNEAMMSLDGANSYADQAKQMLEQMSGGESP